MKEKKLNLGCGMDYRSDYINCDCSESVNPDLVVDLEDKLPFEDNYADEIIIYHTLEHIYNFTYLVHELHRVSKPGSIIKVKVPFYSSWGQYNDPTHVRFFTPFTFNFFRQNKYSHEVSSDTEMFKINKSLINYGVGESGKFNWFMNPIINFNQRVYCRFFAFIFPSSEIQYELEVLK
jgi:hypothetical protein